MTPAQIQAIKECVAVSLKSDEVTKKISQELDKLVRSSAPIIAILRMESPYVMFRRQSWPTGMMANVQPDGRIVIVYNGAIRRYTADREDLLADDWEWMHP